MGNVWIYQTDRFVSLIVDSHWSIVDRVGYGLAAEAVLLKNEHDVSFILRRTYVVFGTGFGQFKLFIS